VRFGMFLRQSSVALFLMTSILVLSTGIGVAAAPSDGRIAVDPSIDPDGFILSQASRRPASELPPACVIANDVHPQVGLARIEVRNGCNSVQRFKVLIAFWFDSECLIVPPSEDIGYEYANAARFDGLAAC
jgi:hypothetical protein